MNSPVPAPDLEALQRLDGCTLANAIESFDLRLRNVGFANGSIRSVFPSLPPVVGYAVTVKVRGASPPVGAHSYLERVDWWNYLLSVPAPRFVIVEDVSSSPGLGALLGEVHVNILRALGCVAAATNGSVRDLPGVGKLGFPLFAGCLSVSHSYVHIVESGTPVEVAGLRIESGDLIHGDQHGIQNVPISLAHQLPEVAGAIVAREQALIAVCQSPGFTVEKLRRIVGGRS
jgi:regulator of RNase E activity RraA